jgi:hypothetical protein
MALVALDMGDETDPAGVVFIGGIVQTLGNHVELRGIFDEVKGESKAHAGKHQS